MRRIILLVTVALMMAAMIVVMAGAASAQVVFFPGSPCADFRSGKEFTSAILTPAGFVCTSGTPSGPSGPPQ
jgi:hypothetical protein